MATSFNYLSQRLINSYQKKICCYDKQQWERSIEDQILFRAENITSGASSGGQSPLCGHSHHHNHQQQQQQQQPHHERLASNGSCAVSGATTMPSAHIASLTNDLIDLDLISGSAYTVKPKSQQGWLSSFGHAIIRVLFLPLYLRWWSERTSVRLAPLLLLLYLLQVIGLRLYYHRGITLFTIHNLPAAFTTNNTATPTATTTTTTTTTNTTNNEFAEVSPTEVLMPIAMMLVLGVIHTQIVGTKSHPSSSSSSSSGRKASALRATASTADGRHPSMTTSSVQSDSLLSRSAMDHSTTSLSSCASSTPPTSVERPRPKRSAKKDTTKSQSVLRARNLPRINVEVSHPVVSHLAVDEPNDADHDSLNASEEDHVDHLHATEDHHQTSHRRYSDSKSQRNRQSNENTAALPLPTVQCRRRHSESYGGEHSPKGEQVRCASALTAGKRKLLKTPSSTAKGCWLVWRKSRSRPLLSKVTHRHCSTLAPKATHAFAHHAYDGSSYDSEGTVSPVTPIASLPGDDWPMIYSDANTSGESEEDNPNQFDQKYSKATFIGVDGESDESISAPLPAKPPVDYTKLAYQSPVGANKASKSVSEPSGGASVAVESPMQSSQTSPSSSGSGELKVSCSVWQHNVWQKVDLSVMDLSSAIIRKVDSIEHSCEYIYLGLIFSVAIALLPTIFRMQYLLSCGAGATAATTSTSGHILSSPSIASESSMVASNSSTPVSSTASMSPDYTDYLIQVDLFGLSNLFLSSCLFYGKSYRLRLVICIAMIERLVLSMLYFFLLCVAERTFKQRFLYSKYFSQITRRDRAKRSQVPFFRLHKVSYLKVWLSVRSYLRRHGPLRSVDTICSTSFILAVCLLTCMCLQLLKDTSESFTSRLICWEMVFWSLAIGIYIMRLMILGSRINQKYRSNLSVLITEQINLHLQLERKPQKKEDLMLANHVLKLAADLIKELETPYKISGFSANPYLYNVTKVVVLSAFSALLTEMLGFKLKLDKINLIK